jgi:hypothetical protein
MTGAAVQNSAALQDGRVRYGAPPFLRFACDAECRIGLRLAKVDEHSHCHPRASGGPAARSAGFPLSWE